MGQPCEFQVLVGERRRGGPREREGRARARTWEKDVLSTKGFNVLALLLWLSRARMFVCILYGHGA